jgi:hypothetical protein
MKELVEMIDGPDDEIKGNHAHVIELNVAKEDLAKDGKVARMLGNPHHSRAPAQGEQAVHPRDHEH